MNIPKKIFEKYEIDPLWFKKDPFSIHGILHEYRVLVYCYLIGTAEKADVGSLCRAAIFHDTQRIDDDLDPEHGKKAAEWFLENFDLKNKEKIKYLIWWHMPEDSMAPEMNLDLKCFKDADALDRWRIHNFDEKYLRTKTGRKLVSFSKKFFELTESQKQIIIDPRENILKALHKLGYLA